ncbi:MAG: xanthan lyase, partial [Alistipes sp.]|nr:xanthan lyase [Alistipes sp.]
MKNRLLYTIVFLTVCSTAFAAKIGYATRAEIAKTINRIVAREITGADIRVQSVKISRGQVQIYASPALSYYPFREKNTRALYDSVRAVLPREYRKARIQLYTDNHEIRELIPLAYHTNLPKKGKYRPITFVNRSERPLITRLSALAKPSQGLEGRHIAVWQSHGRYFDQEENRWKWQRAQL